MSTTTFSPVRGTSPHILLSELKSAAKERHNFLSGDSLFDPVFPFDPFELRPRKHNYYGKGAFGLLKFFHNPQSTNLECYTEETMLEAIENDHIVLPKPFSPIYPAEWFIQQQKVYGKLRYSFQAYVLRQWKYFFSDNSYDSYDTAKERFNKAWYKKVPNGDSSGSSQCSYLSFCQELIKCQCPEDPYLGPPEHNHGFVKYSSTNIKMETKKLPRPAKISCYMSSYYNPIVTGDPLFYYESTALSTPTHGLIATFTIPAGEDFESDFLLSLQVPDYVPGKLHANDKASHFSWGDQGLVTAILDGIGGGSYLYY